MTLDGAMKADRLRKARELAGQGLVILVGVKVGITVIKAARKGQSRSRMGLALFQKRCLPMLLAVRLFRASAQQVAAPQRDVASVRVRL